MSRTGFDAILCLVPDRNLQFSWKSNGVVGAFHEEEFGILAFLSQLGVKGDGSAFILLDSIIGIGDHYFFHQALGFEYVLRT